jgi:hypothetical protein
MKIKKKGDMMNSRTHATYGNRLSDLEHKQSQSDSQQDRFEKMIEANKQQTTSLGDKLNTTNQQLAELSGAFNKALPGWAAVIAPMVEAKTRELDNGRTKTTIAIAAIAVTVAFGAFWHFRGEMHSDVVASNSQMEKRFDELERRMAERFDKIDARLSSNQQHATNKTP